MNVCGTTYFPRDVSYTHKRLMKSTTGDFQGIGGGLLTVNVKMMLSNFREPGMGKISK